MTVSVVVTGAAGTVFSGNWATKPFAGHGDLVKDKDVVDVLIRSEETATCPLAVQSSSDPV